MAVKLLFAPKDDILSLLNFFRLILFDGFDIEFNLLKKPIPTHSEKIRANRFYQSAIPFQIARLPRTKKFASVFSTRFLAAG